MKFLLLASAVMTAGAVASAHALLPLPQAATGSASSPARGSSHQRTATAPAADVASVAQIPVPRLAGARGAAHLSLSPAEATAASVKSERLSEAGAKAAIERDGYKGVSGVMRTASGTWQARALRGEAVVVVRVDDRGSVSAD